MRIALYPRQLPSDQTTWNGQDRFCHEVIGRILATHPDHEFLLLTDEARTGWTDTFGALRPVPIGTGGTGRIAAYRRYQWSLPSLLKKEKAAVFVSFGRGLPLRGGVPSLVVVPNGGIPEPGLSGRTRQFLEAASLVVALSDQGARELQTLSGCSADRIVTIHPGAGTDFRPLGWEEREAVKRNHTGEREYFIHVGDLHSDGSVVALLKGFSVLKKRLRSNMVLVLAGDLEPGYRQFPELLRTYHFKDDVQWIRPADRSALQRLVGAAYALVCLSPGGGFDAPVLEALRCQVPVLAATGMEKTAGDAALYFKAGDAADLGDRFCEIYKDESLRARLIAKSAQQAAGFGWDQTADALWSCLLRVSRQNN